MLKKTLNCYSNHVKPFKANLDLWDDPYDLLLQTFYHFTISFLEGVAVFFLLLFSVNSHLSFQWQAEIAPHLVFSFSPVSHTPPSSTLHHKGLIKTDWILGDHTCLRQVRYQAHVCCVYLCVTLCGYVLSTSVCNSTSCALLLKAVPSVCMRFILVHLLMLLVFYSTFACDLCQWIHMHFMLACAFFSEPLKALTLDGWLDSARRNQSLLCFNVTPVRQSVM